MPLNLLQLVKKYLLSPSYVPNTILILWWNNSEQGRQDLSIHGANFLD